VKTPTPVYRSLRGGMRETIRAAIAIAYGDPPPTGLPYGWAVDLASRLGVTSQHVATVATCMRKGTLPDRGSIIRCVGSLPERLQQLERDRPGLSRGEQASILGTTAGAVRDAAYRLRLMGGHAPSRVRRLRPSDRRVVVATGWTP
jgi:hypothetical protein